MARWFILGFTADAVVGAWQDARLAEACVLAWNAAGRPKFQVLEMASDGEHILKWYVHEETAQLLDAHRVSWRGFLIGDCASPPAGAHEALKKIEVA